MTLNRSAATRDPRTIVLCLFATFIISGILNPIGLISGQVAEAYDISITDTVSRFGFFTVGVFVGYIVSFVIFDYVGLKTVFTVGYAIVVASVASIYLSDSASILSAGLLIIGVSTGVLVCGASTLVSWLWEGRPRQTMLIAQDAMFNAGGILFTFIATWFVTRDFGWTATYKVVAGCAVAAALLAATTSIDSHRGEPGEPDVQTSWNAGIFVVGISVMLFMASKISVFIWAPQFVEQAHGATAAESGRLMTNIFVAAFFGSLIGTYIVSKVRIEFFLTGMLCIGAGGLWALVNAGNLGAALNAGYIVGMSVGATFNAYMAFGLSFVPVPTHKNVAWVLLAGSVGSAGAPIFSSMIVEAADSVRAALLACLSIQVAVLISVVALALARAAIAQKYAS